MIFEIIKQPLLDDVDSGGGVNGENVADSQNNIQQSSQENVTVTEGVKDSGVAEQKNDVNNFFADRRRKQEIDEYKKIISEYEPKIKRADDLEAKIKKLEKRLPDGFNTIDDFIESIDDDYQPQNSETIYKKAVDESVISTIAKKIIEEHPDVKKAKTYNEREEKRMESEYLIDNIKKLQEKFPDVKEIKDVPRDVLESWLKNEVDSKKYGRTLVSYYYEMKGDELIEKAKNQVAGQIKTKEAGTSHTSKVQGTGSPSELDSVVVPSDIQKLYKGMRIPQDKWKQHYVKYLKNR
jgi:hypothetical protein